MKTKLLFLSFAFLALSSTAGGFEITPEHLSNMSRLEEGAMHVHGRRVTSSGYTNEFVSPLIGYHTLLGLSEDEFAAALLSYARKNIWCLLR